MNRRTVFQICGSSLLCLNSGCLGWFRDTVRLCEIDVDIDSDLNTELQLRLAERSDTIYEETHKIGSSEASTDGFTIDNSDLPVTEGNFTLRVKVNGQAWKEWYLPRYADGSISVHLQIEGSRPEFWFSTTDVDC